MKCQTVRHRTWDKGLGMQFQCLSTLSGGDLAPHCVRHQIIGKWQKNILRNDSSNQKEPGSSPAWNSDEFRISVNPMIHSASGLWGKHTSVYKCPLQENQTPLWLSKSQYHDGATRPHVPRQLHGAIHVPLEWARPWLRPNLDCCEAWACWTLLQFVAVSKSTSTWQPY